jgi:hypothetical protein
MVFVSALEYVGTKEFVLLRKTVIAAKDGVDARIAADAMNTVADALITKLIDNYINYTRETIERQDLTRFYLQEANA